MSKTQGIPTEQDWKSPVNGADECYAYRMFFGKTRDEAKELFYQNPLERSFDLMYMPREPFRFYFLAFKDYIQSREFPYLDMGTSYHAFFSAFCACCEDKPQYLTELVDDLLPVLEDIVVNQEKYGNDSDIFGDYSEQLDLALNHVKALT